MFDAPLLSALSAQQVPLLAASPDLLTHWRFEPSIVVGLILFTAGYFYLTGPLRQRRGWGPPPNTRQRALFILAGMVLVLALLSPLDELSDTYLFSAHMVQHLLLATLWPPLVILALPRSLIAGLRRLPVLLALGATLTYPALALILFNVDIYAWHIPYLYDLTLSDENVHILEHLTFMALGVLVWWPVLNPLVERRLSYPFQILYLFANGMLMMGLGIVFTFSPKLFYTAYVHAPRLWEISASTDQQLGGLIMWYPGNIPYGVWLVVAFYRWFEGERVPVAEEQTASAESPTI